MASSPPAGVTIASFTHPYASLPVGISPFPYVCTPATARFITPAGLLPIALDFKWPFSYQMNFTIQRQLGRGFTVSAGYVRTLSHYLAFSPDVNYPVLTSTVTSSNFKNRRPYGVGLLSTINMMESNGAASYHAHQIKVRKAMSRTLSLTAFYYLQQVVIERADGRREHRRWRGGR